MSKNPLFDFVEEIGYHGVRDFFLEERQEIANEIDIITVDNRFNKVYRNSNFFTNEMCKWIIYEAERFAVNNGGWTKKRHRNYPTTDLPVREITTLWTPLVNLIVKEIFPIIAENYKLNPYFLGIGDLFVVKYDVKGQDHLEFHRDGSLLSFNILLNDDFDGGGTTINHPEGSVSHLSKKGDLFIHSGKLLHCGNKITRGRRYILVCFVEYIPLLRRRPHEIKDANKSSSSSDDDLSVVTEREPLNNSQTNEGLCLIDESDLNEKESVNNNQTNEGLCLIGESDLNENNSTNDV